MAGAAGSTGFSACSRRALLPLRGTRRRGRSASSPLRTQTSSPTSCEGYEPRSAIARVPARLDAFVSAAPKISRTPRDSRATSPGSSARARSRRRDTVSHLRIHPAWLARYRRRRDSPHRPSRPIPHTKKKIRGFLKHKQWETRVASARTIAHICEGVKHATVADIARLEGVSPEQAVERAAHEGEAPERHERGTTRRLTPASAAARVRRIGRPPRSRGREQPTRWMLRGRKRRALGKRALEVGSSW